jgi:hypothetical protein
MLLAKSSQTANIGMKELRKWCVHEDNGIRRVLSVEQVLQDYEHDVRDPCRLKI